MTIYTIYHLWQAGPRGAQAAEGGQADGLGGRPDGAAGDDVTYKLVTQELEDKISQLEQMSEASWEIHLVKEQLAQMELKRTERKTREEAA